MSDSHCNAQSCDWNKELGCSCQCKGCVGKTVSVVSQPGNAIEILTQDRDEWKKRCLAAEACNVQFGDVLRRADALIGDLKVRCLAAEEASRRGARAMMKVSKDDNYVERRFPTKAARKIADEAIDKLDEHEDMRTYLDVWLAAYRKAGGVEKKI